MRSLVPVLAITLGLMVTAPAVAQPADQGAPSSAVATVATQDLRAPDRTVSALAQAPASTSDGGLSTALILLLAVGGAVVLGATAVVGTRWAQAHGHLHRHVSG